MTKTLRETKGPIRQLPITSLWAFASLSLVNSFLSLIDCSGFCEYRVK